MLITILTAGTRGDTQPFIALGLALKKAGYNVRIAASATFEDFIKGFGLDFHAVAGDVTEVASRREIVALQTANPIKIILSFEKLKTFAFALQKDLYAACRGADAVVYHPGATIGYFAARALNVPSVLASPFPITPTKEFPALVFYDSVRLGRQANLLTHRVFAQALWLTSGSPIKRFWKESFGGVPADFANPFGQQQTAARPTVIAGSNHVFPRPHDWPEGVYNTGYWFLEEDDWRPPAELLSFLQQGPPPVYVGFGSMSDPATAARTTNLVVNALKRAGQRGVLATGWSGMTALEELPEDMVVLESAPHSWLFPKMAAVVHHGGAGTTAAGLRAGVPSIIVPHAVDQFAWGRRVCELGVGPPPIPKKKLSAARLAGAITQASQPEIKRAANRLGEKIRSENGVEVAVRVVAACLEQESVF